MGREEYSEDFCSNYPGRSTVSWMKPSAAPYSTIEYSPFDSSGIDPTAFRKNAFAFDNRTGHQPRDFRHYDTHGGKTYGERDSGYTHRGRDNFGSSDRYGGSGYSQRGDAFDSCDRYASSGLGDKLSRDAAIIRGGGGGYGSNSSSGFGSEYRAPLTRRDSGARRFESSSSSRSHSRFDDFMRSSSSGRRHRDRSPPARYFGPDDIGRSSSSYSTRPSISRDRGYEYGGGFESQGGYGSSGGYTTQVVTPGGGSGGYGSSSRRGSRSRRDGGRFSID